MASLAPPAAERRVPQLPDRAPDMLPVPFERQVGLPGPAPLADSDLRQQGIGNAAIAASGKGASDAALAGARRGIEGSALAASGGGASSVGGAPAASGFARAQSGIGNAALAAPRGPGPQAKEEGAKGGGGPAPGPAPAEEGEEDAAPKAGGLSTLKAMVAKASGRLRKRGNSKALVAQTRKAAVKPEAAGKARAAQVTLAGLDSAEKETAEPFDSEGFKAALRAKLDKAMPPGKSGDDVKKALSQETGAEVAGEMKTQLAGTQAKAVGDLPAAVKKQEDPGSHSPAAPPALAQPSPGGPAPVPNAALGVPERIPDKALDTTADRNDADAQLKSQDLSQDQLKRSNEPSFVETAETRDSAEQHAQAGPPQVRAVEAAARQEALGRGAGLLSQGFAGLFGSRVAGFLGVFSVQDKAKAKEEAERARIAGDLDAIQSKTRSDVKVMLDIMEAGAVAVFSLGLAEALREFDRQREQTEANIRKAARIEARQNRGRVATFLNTPSFDEWYADWRDLDEGEVERTIAVARKAFNAAVERAIDAVTGLVKPILEGVKARIARGRKEAADYVLKQDESVAGIAAVELDRINGEFDTLSASVDSRKDAMLGKLGENYSAAAKKMEDKAQAFRDANKSWWQKLKEKVRGVIRAIVQIKDMFASILSKLAGVVGAIIRDPGGFLGNFVTAVKTGLNNFTSNFLTHLKAGFFEWLFGQAAEAGIQIPKKFDAAGIFGLIASVIGLTIENVRARAVAKVGEPAVAALEAGAGILLTLKEKGIEGLWELLVDKLESLKESIVEQIQSMLEIEVIKAGIMWLIGLLNPVSAFIKACKAIYEIVMFFVNNGKRILDFVNTVIDSVGDVAKGSLGAASAKIEDSLARLIPLIIGFLAALLGLGGIAGKVKAIIQRIQAPVNRAIDAVIDKAVSLVKAGVGAVKGMFAKKDDADAAKPSEDPARDAKVKAGLEALEKAENDHEDAGKISKEQAAVVASEVHRKHPVFKSIVVVDGGDTWDYEIVVNPKWRKRGGFKGAGKAVKQGIAHLRAILGAEKIPWKFKHGLAAQLNRAEVLFNSGRLSGVEVTHKKGVGRVDFELINPTKVVEYKFWTEEYLEANIGKLAKQLTKYHQTNKPIVLELAATKTKPVSIEFVEDQLRNELRILGIAMTSVSIIEGGTIISIEVELITESDEAL